MKELTQLIGLELFKIFSKIRTYIGFIAIGVLIPLIHVAMLIEGKQYIDVAIQNLKGTFNFQGDLLNGYMITYIVLMSLYIHIPLLITLVTGDLLAGEATSGTYRLLLTKPISRLKIVVAKYISALIYTGLLILWLAICSLGLGVILFGKGDLFVVHSGITIIKENEVFFRFLASFGFAFLSMSLVATISFFFSVFVENSIGPIVSTMAFIIIFSIINVLDIGFFRYIQPFLFTGYLPGWKYFFDLDIQYDKVFQAIGVLMAHIVILAGATFYYFNKKDILS